jgi:hypothetical protein
VNLAGRLRRPCGALFVCSRLEVRTTAFQPIAAVGLNLV